MNMDTLEPVSSRRLVFEAEDGGVLMQLKGVDRAATVLRDIAGAVHMEVASLIQVVQQIKRSFLLKPPAKHREEVSLIL